MFRSIDDTTPCRSVSLQLEGRTLQVREGDSVAMALLKSGVGSFRETPVSGAPRAPLCLMGVCFECLVQVDGQANVQACMVTVAEGMQVRLQQGARQAETGS